MNFEGDVQVVKVGSKEVPDGCSALDEAVEVGNNVSVTISMKVVVTVGTRVPVLMSSDVSFKGDCLRKIAGRRHIVEDMLPPDPKGPPFQDDGHHSLPEGSETYIPDDSPFIQYLKDRITYIGIEDFQALGIETALPLNSIKRRNVHPSRYYNPTSSIVDLTVSGTQ
uniref:Uncharacterized protein n=1 Tax=Moniliophthora roreri TaxID=221103 RepID=A0A0W0FWQ1_MONRR